MVDVMLQRVRRYSHHIEKKYFRSDLLLDSRSLRQRLETICHVSHIYENIPRITIKWSEEILVMRQQRVKKMPFPSENQTACKNHLERLALVLDQLPADLVHGDINCKNILFDGTDLQLIDWEPALVQKRFMQETLMYTEPYISQHDRTQSKLTKETDKIGFFYAILRLLNKQPRIPSPYHLVTARIYGKFQLTPEPEERFISRNFTEILHLAFANPEWQPKIFDGRSMAGYEITEPDRSQNE